ncbi:GNAT family N-acetyltransferase [Guptibacillus algicola]|uniref:GNAT family N-acetyltransferase n=1 Tax=Guptibacillus algicola TaxID=225844 RepID=UPI001CD6111C|nr:GNAT family N-acetyltransferase [Alkalihalobacillus algicola]MCA0987548.1 GNAT family N-acetyltransferase [Alkalihalobacillus algicola]
MSIEKRLVDNFVYKVSYFAKRIETMSVAESDSITIVDAGLPSDTFNVIGIQNKEALFAVRFHDALSLFKRKKYPLSVWYWNTDDWTFESELQKHGLEEAETNIAMVKEFGNEEPSPVLPRDFEIKVVETCEDVSRFGALIASFFGESQEGRAVKTYYEKVASSVDMKSSDLKLYIGMAEGKPVTTGSIIVAKDSIGIFDMGTSEVEQGKGYGSTMFRYLLHEAAQYKKKWCFLQASQEGIGIYKKAGFESIGEMKVYGVNTFN